MEFILSGVLKKKFYERNPQTEDELKDFISNVSIEIGAD